MLSDHERQELAAIEQWLTAEDHRLAAALGPGRTRSPRRWPIRALFGFGIFLIAVAVATATDGLFLQGLLCVAGAAAWYRWRTVRARKAAHGSETDARARPDGTPPEWFRPV